MDKEMRAKNDIKVLQKPGGNSNFSLGWDVPEKK